MLPRTPPHLRAAVITSIPETPSKEMPRSRPQCIATTEPAAAAPVSPVRATVSPVKAKTKTRYTYQMIDGWIHCRYTCIRVCIYFFVTPALCLYHRVPVRRSEFDLPTKPHNVKKLKFDELFEVVTEVSLNL